MKKNLFFWILLFFSGLVSEGRGEQELPLSHGLENPEILSIPSGKQSEETPQPSSPETEKKDRLPAVQGTFYAENPQELSAYLDTLLSTPSPSLGPGKRLMGLVVPHAGYLYSGQVAAAAYKKAKDQPISTVLLIGPCHEGNNLHGAALWSTGSWKTPLGDTPVHTKMAQHIQSKGGLFRHPASFHEAEHSLETQIPFLQKVLPKARIVPILINNPHQSIRLARALRPYLAERSDVMVIASTDLSHYYHEQKARSVDGKTLAVLLEGNPRTFLKLIKQRGVELCGAAATLTFLELKRLLRKGTLSLLDYKNTSHITQDPQEVVGYASLSWEAPWTVEPAPPTLSLEAQSDLKNQAFIALESYLLTGLVPTSTSCVPLPDNLGGVFVTLETADGNLRGCMGSLDPRESLTEQVQKLVIQAAEDPRFPPISFEEMWSLSIKISLLSSLEPFQDPDDILLKTHGVIVQKDHQSGLFLPEVADHFLGRREFLSALCQEKAGLDPLAWRDPETKLFRFTTLSF